MADRVENSRLGLARLKWRMAVGCAVLSLAISIITVAVSFRPETEREVALQTLRQHRALLADNQRVLAANEDELSKVTAVLNALKANGAR